MGNRKFNIIFEDLTGELPPLPAHTCSFENIWPFLARHFKVNLEGFTIISKFPVDEDHIQEVSIVIEDVLVSFRES